MFYTGIGSRKTPDDILDLMHDLGVDLAVRGYTLRSGGAGGADSAFEGGCDEGGGDKEIYLPWKGFNDNQSELYHIPYDAYNIAEKIYGSRWRSLSPSVKKLMTRNIPQVTGIKLDMPSDFVVCWTPDGCTSKSGRTKDTGGTGQAIAYADTVSVPVFNLKNNEDITKLMKHIEISGALQW